MSRGLGTRQTLILRALAQLEREDGAGRFYVWSVLEVAWNLGLRQEEADARAARKAADADWLADVRARASEGDRRAHEQLRRHQTLAMLASAIRRPVNRSRQRRPAGAYLIEDVNPSRCFALLARRGLVERNGQRGPGAAVGLTEAGRAEAGQLQAETANPDKLSRFPAPGAAP